MVILWNAVPLCYVLLLVWVRVTECWQWATPEQEAQDEKNDVEILKAVFTSMEDYWMRRLISGRRRKRADSVVCYGEIGCFEDTGPFSYIDMLPSSPEEISTRFLLYSGRTRGDNPLLDIPFFNMTNVWSWASKAFNSSASTKIIVHGFGSSCNNVWVYEMRSALMSVEDCNVICVDWEAGAIIPNYVRAAANTRLVGKQLAMLIRGLQENVGLILDNVHLIGFSLGAHVAGFAGAELKNISRITGLDPAGPLFESQDPRARLDSTDAKFVDVIHSNGENLILGGLGSWQPMGHVDFYPNGGRMQKGCTNLFVGAVSDIIWSASDIEGRSLCNHRRAYKFFTDSVSPRCHFPAFPCESYDKFIEGKCFPCSAKFQCGNMGFYADKSSARGTLYLITREEEPFCAHQYQVNVESSPSNLPAVSYGKLQITLFGENTINETFTLTRKDDEELGVGASLSKIVVPHPALQELTAVEITYTAYSGWISSGLKKWSIDKIKISDSFGKSVSHCKKDLILESNVSVMLKLYPGECNLPKEKQEVTTTEEVDPFFVTESARAMEDKNATSGSKAKEEAKIWSKNKTVDGFPAYDINREIPEVEKASGGNESSEPSAIAAETAMPKAAIQAQENNYTLKVVRKNEITEPVLQPKPSAKEEIDEPVLKSIEKVKTLGKRKDGAMRKSPVRPRGIDLSNFGNIENRIDGNFSVKQWIPSVELFPPPLGGKQLWETVTEEAKPVMKPIALKSIVPPFLQKSQKKDLPPFVTTLQNKILQYEKLNKTSGKENETSLGGQKIKFIEIGQNDFPKNEDGSITVQLFPQHLAAILKQAEQYAKMSLFSPLDIFTRNRFKSTRDRNETKAEQKRNKNEENHKRLQQEAIATPRSMDVRPKSILPTIYEYIEKSFENVKSLLGFSHESKKEASYVPYYHSSNNNNNNNNNNNKSNNTKQSKEIYIPLTVT